MAVEAPQFAGSDKKFFVVGAAAGINTQSPRQSIKDEQFGWLENMMPVAEGNFRAMYGNGAAIYTTTPPRTIIYHYEYNITGLTSTTNYSAVFLDDGTAYQINLGNAAVTTISAVAGTFYPGNLALGSPLPQCTQYSQQGIIIVATPPSGSGYWFWNGSALYGAGTLAPNVVITNSGSGYFQPPLVTASGGHGTGAVFSAQITPGGQVSGVTVVNPGSGYTLGDVVTLGFSGGNQAGTGANLTAVMSFTGTGSGATFVNNYVKVGSNLGIDVYTIASVTVTNGGSGYSGATQMTFTGGAVTFGIAAGTPIISGGVITGVHLTTGGTYYVGGLTVTTAAVDAGGYFVSSVTIGAGGSLYGPSAKITATGGGTPQSQASISPIVTAGAITNTTINNGGLYLTNVAPTLTVTDTATTAAATLAIMPFGIQGTCVEMYQSRAWVGYGPNIYFSAAALPFDFNIGDGAGAFNSNDSFLRREFTALRQSGSFLYLFADSSINVISNVQQSGSPPIPTFNNQNVTPQIGTPWHNSVVAIEDALIFANIQGVFKLRGGNVQKISDDLDGIFLAATTTLQNDTAIQQPTAALMTINEKVVYMLVVPVQGPLDGSPRNGLVMWDQQKWWVGSQPVTIAQVSTQEINSTIQAWINTGTTLNAAFTTASGSLTKTWQTKLWSAEGPFTAKQTMRLYTMALDKTTGGYTFTGTFDFMLDNGAPVVTQAFTVSQVNLTGSGSQNATVRGNYVGFTLHTTKDDFVLLSHSVLYQEQSPMP